MTGLDLYLGKALESWKSMNTSWAYSSYRLLLPRYDHILLSLYKFLTFVRCLILYFNFSLIDDGDLLTAVVHT